MIELDHIIASIIYETNYWRLEVLCVKKWKFHSIFKRDCPLTEMSICALRDIVRSSSVHLVVSDRDYRCSVVVDRIRLAELNPIESTKGQLF